MASSPTHFYRLEISGGHTGSAYRYYSEIAGTLDEIERVIADEAGNGQGLAFLTEASTFELELHEDGKRLGVWNLYPALTIESPEGEILSFLASGDIEGIVPDLLTDYLLEHPVLGPMLDGEVDPTPYIDFTVLDLPTPRGKPLAAGSKATFERDGRTETQAYGRFDEWDDSIHRPSDRAEKARRAAKEAARAAEKLAAKSATKTTTARPAAKKTATRTAAKPTKPAAKKPAAKK